jgi:hypothetical protein
MPETIVGDKDGRRSCFVGHILLVAVAVVCVILLIKAGFDRAEARHKRKK